MSKVNKGRNPEEIAELERIQKAIEEIEGFFIRVTAITKDGAGKFHVDIDNSTISYKMLQAVEKATGFKEIDVDSETRNGGYCETCSYEYSAHVLILWNESSKGCDNE